MLVSFTGRFPRAASRLALLSYLTLVGAGAYVIADLATINAKTASLAIDVAITQSAETAISTPDPNWATPRALRDSVKVTVGSKADSTAFAHSRPAPRIVEQVGADELENLKQQVSERVVDEGSGSWHSGEAQTYRTMCVRLCDGAYFQVSYSTTRDRFQRDETMCASRCGAPTRLFVQRNPGGSPETMQDRSGRSYVALPTAFQFRRGAVSGCSCRAEAWEQASKDRHRLYALEQQQEEGKPIDVAELTRLREQVATTTGTATKGAVLSAASAVEGAHPSASTSSSATVAGAPLASPITTAALPAKESVFDADHILAQREGAAARRSLDGAVAGNAALTIRASAKPVKKTESAKNVKKAVRGKIENPTESTAAALVVEGHDDAKVETKAAKVAKAAKPKQAGKQAAASDQRQDSTKQKLPTMVVEKPIWGVGRNAPHLSKGNSAYDAFARNFY